MIWKKSWFSVIVWAAGLLGSSAALILYGYETILRMGVEDEVIALAVGCGVWAVALVLFCVLRLLANGIHSLHKKSSDGEEKTSSKVSGKIVIEGMIFICILAIGLSLRVMNLHHAGESANYFDLAKVTQDGGIPQIVHGATYFYVQLLHLLFTFVGNHWIAGIWMQITLQLIAVIILYFGVRKVANCGAALVVSAYMMLMPSQILCGMTYSPDMMFLCVAGIGLLCVANFLQKLQDHQKSYNMMYSFVVGAVVAFVCYLDISGFLIVAAALTCLWIKQDECSMKDGDTEYNLASESARGHNKYLNFLLFLGGLIGLLAACFALDAYICGKSIEEIWMAWLELYKPQSFSFFWIEENRKVLWPISLVILVVILVAYWCRRDGERFLPWLTMLILVCLMKGFGLSSQYMNSFNCYYWIVCVVGVLGLTECFVFDYGFKNGVKDSDMYAVHQDKINLNKINSSEIVSSEINSNEIIAEEKSDALHSKEIVMEEKIENKEKIEKKEIHYIENPLPLPKKHIKKSIEFGFEPLPEHMKFDIGVEEDDEFDI